MVFKIAYLIDKYKGKIKSFSLYFWASLLQILSGIILSPILSVNLVHRDFAIIGYYNSFISLLTPIIGLSFASYYSKTYFKKSIEDREELKETMVSSLILIGGVNLLLSLCVFYVFSLKYDTGFQFSPYALICFGSIFFSNLYSFYLINLRLNKEASKYFRISVVRHILYFIIIYALCAVFKLGATGSLLATLITSFLMSLFSIYKLNIRFRINMQILKEAFLFCWPLILAGCIHYFTNGFDRALLAGMQDDYTFGLYNIGMRFSRYIMLFTTSFTMVIEPDLYKSIAQKKYKRLLLLILGTLILNIAIVLLFILFLPFIVNLLTVGRYCEAIVYARILALKNIGGSFFFMTAIIINAFGYSKITLLNRIFSAVLIGIMYKFLINSFGFIGAAWGQVFSYVIMIILSTMFVYFKYNQKKLRQEYEGSLDM